mgnify:CR=1 FL=1
MLGRLAIAGRVFSGFDDQMRTVKAITGATAEEFDRLTEKAKLLDMEQRLRRRVVGQDEAIEAVSTAAYDKFRVDADVEYNRLLLWANDIELKEVENLLAKLGYLPVGGKDRTDRARAAALRRFEIFNTLHDDELYQCLPLG